MKGTVSKGRISVLLAILLIVCLTALIAVSLFVESAFAAGAESEEDSAISERTPVATYIIGDSTVTAESGFTFDEVANTYIYKDHAAGWSAALANSAELYNKESADANLVKVQLASDWVAQKNDSSTSFGSGAGFNDFGALQIPAKSNLLLDLNSYDINRNLSEPTKAGYVIIIDGKFELADRTAEMKDGQYISGSVTGGNCNQETTPFFTGGITVSISGKFIMTGGKITGNTAGTNGGGISAAYGASEIKIYGGEISDNIANGNGGGIYSVAPLTMTNGIIRNNQSKSGAGVYLQDANNTSIISGGTICDNIAKGNGGGVYAMTNLTIGSVEIKNNVATASGGGIYICNGRTLNLENSPVIQGNYGKVKLEETKNDGITDNAYIAINAVMSISDILSEQAKIGFSAQMGINNILIKSYTGAGKYNVDENCIALDPNKYFSYDGNDDYTFVLDKDDNVWGSTSIPSFSAGYGETAVEITDKYGYADAYSNGKKLDYSLTGGSGEVTITKDGEIFSGDIQDAGVYILSYELTDKITVAYKVVLKPQDLSDGNGAVATGVTYTLSATTDWMNGDGNYINTYDGQAKTSPMASVSLNNNALTSADFAVSYLLNGEPVDELKEVGTYTVVINGTGNYTGTVYATELFIIEQNTETSYTVTWQYYDGDEWKNLADSDGAVFTYTSADYTHRLRIVLKAEGLETRYVYADGVTEYNLADGENANDVAFDLTLSVDRDGETVILNAGRYNLALDGTPNYVVEEEDTTSAVTVAPYNLANIVSGSADTANIDAALNNATYNAQAKELSLTASLVLNGNVIELTDTDYDYVVKYLKDGEEIEVEQFILGGTYKVYITSKNANLTGTPGVAGTFTINKANNRVTLSDIGNWLYGNYDERINHFEWSAAWLYDGAIDGTEREYVYFTVMSDGKAVNETLTRFTEITDEIKAALNALGAGNYTLLAEVDETASYTSAQDTAAFEIVKATNSFVSEPSVVEWKWNGFDKNINQLFLASVYGNDTAVKTVKDGKGNVIAGLESFVDVTDEIAAKLNALDAGDYTVTVEVAETNNYSGLEKTVGFTVHKADNGWDTPLDIYSWTWGEYTDDNGIKGSAISGGEVYCAISDRNTGNVIAGYEHIAIGTSLKDLPAGNYVLTGYVDESKNYAAYSSSFNFNVYKAHNDWTSLPGIKSWVAGYYDKTENAVGGASQHGTVSYKITDENGNVVTDLANAEVGKYTLTMTVEGTDNYEGLTYTSTFNVFESRDLKGGEIAGITIASVVVAGLAAAVIALLINRRKTA